MLDWGGFAKGTNLDAYTFAVLDYINFCTGNVTETKIVKVFPKQNCGSTKK